MVEDKYAEYVGRVLAELGVESSRIPETSVRTPDLQASDGEDDYLIEVKTRTDDEAIDHELRSRGEAYRTTPLGWASTPAAIFDDAVKQLNSFGRSDVLKIVWMCLLSKRGAAETFADQVRSTLYGISRIAGSGRGAQAPPCYYFSESVFFKHRELAGVVLEIPRGRMLCLNDHSLRFERLKRSKLAKGFGDAVIDVPRREMAGLCLVADCMIDRKQRQLVLDYLANKYDIENPFAFNLDEHASLGVVRRDDSANGAP